MTKKLDSSEKLLSLGIFIAYGMILIMILIGGATRLTGSGLSIVEWRLISGIFPPLSKAAWQHTFELYQKTPEFLKVNSWMDLESFKNIFWLEYIHRLWGRALGLFSLMLLFYGSSISSLRQRYRKPLLILVGAIASQGILGWIMVKSGLVDDPHVSAYRLCLHFLLGAFLLYYTLTLAFKVKGNTLQKRRLYYSVLGLLCLTLAYGAFVAGLKAGLLYNTFPLMDGRVLPEGFWSLHPFYRNFFENHGVVQFIHRMLAFSVLGLIAFYVVLNRKESKWVWGLGGMVMVQIILGVLTLLYQVPSGLALAHQGGALILLSLMIVTRLSAKNGVLRESR